MTFLRSLRERGVEGVVCVTSISLLLAHSADYQGALINPAGEHLAARVSHGPYRARQTFPVPRVVIDRIPLLLIGIPRPAMLPFQELIAAELVFLPPVVGCDTAGLAELCYGVGRAASETDERLVGFRLLFCAVNPYDPAGPLLVQDFLRSSKGLDG